MKKIIGISLLAVLFNCGCTHLTRCSTEDALRFHNSQFDFTFSLPADWRGYSVLIQQWQGFTYSPAKDDLVEVAHGPMIVLRHPRWSAEDRYLDIPILVFTPDQWRADQDGKFGIGTGGFDEELWRNSKYVFAMSTRWNADDAANGWQEACDIVGRNRAALNQTQARR